ncbi:MAG: hypothetical protein ACKOA9_13735 [Actinomycetota bacterium]
MSARRASREPYTLRRKPREVWVAIVVAVGIVLVTAIAVWILAPGDSPSPIGTPAVSTPITVTPPGPPVTAPAAVPSGDTPAPTGSG